jgi:excisionase family DNA binding protein
MSDKRGGDILTEERLYSKSDAASYLGVSERTVDRWIEAGRLAGRKFGKQRKFTRAELDALAEDQPNVPITRNDATGGTVHTVAGGLPVADEGSSA